MRFHLCFFVRQVLLEPHVTWWDNFNNAFAVCMQVLGKDAHMLCNWTGIANRITHESVDTSHIDLHLTVEAFPADMFDAPRWESLRASIQFLTEPASVERFSARNWTQIHDVRRVPIKAKVHPTLFPAIHRRSTDGRTGLTNFYPQRMSAENIGSNLGLLRLLRAEHDKQMALPADERKYKIIVADCNIFLRIVKVSCLRCLQCSVLGCVELKVEPNMRSHHPLVLSFVVGAL
jgi:hypothetical protein